MSGLKPLTEQTGEELLDQFRNLLGRVIFDASLQGKLTAVEKEILKRMSLDIPGDELRKAFEAGVRASELGIDYENGASVNNAFDSWLRSRRGGKV